MAAVAIDDFAPWREFRLPSSPFEDTPWAFNPTIVRVPDGDHAHAGQWIVNLRCANYHLPGSGIQGNSTGSRSGVANRIRNRNWALVLDPDRGWNAIDHAEVIDRSDIATAIATRGPNGPSSHVLGYEDLRLAWSPRDGLIASGTTMSCNEQGVLEIAVLDLDGDLSIANVQPLRGPWSERHQKNWMPFLGHPSGDVRWLYAPQDGGVHDRDGRLCATHRRAPLPDVPRASMVAPQHVRDSMAKATHFQNGAMGVAILASRQRVAPPRQTPLDLRGGTQLVPVPEAGADRYLGLVHAARVTQIKWYTHHVVLVSGTGDLLAISPAVKLSPEHGIEFAAGLARDGDLAVVTYGVEDDSARLAETSVSALLRTLEAVP
jgi:hypothetical protein